MSSRKAKEVIAPEEPEEVITLRTPPVRPGGPIGP
jgi:hypothetical protein